jgi:hypothetical protein
MLMFSTSPSNDIDWQAGLKKQYASICCLHKAHLSTKANTGLGRRIEKFFQEN